ncbi:coiled-coil domain-containing protein [Aliarcobacter butzleri]|uniref:coiled-coil domain-containing protein n=1 Tax=Aliarcobacter butzleri TaxID=28197 RepID=UPI002B248F17|nr:hypothetical protein [Aliarcobacter butzleri]
MEETLNNFINVRLKTYNHTKQLNILKHNLRKIASLSDFDNEEEFEVFKELINSNHLGSNFILLNGGISIDLSDKSMINNVYDTLVNNYFEDRKIHNEAYKKKWHANLRERNSTWCEGVFTFSEQMKLDLGNKYTLEEMNLIALNCLNEIAAEMGAEVKYIVGHTKETTFHYHWAVSNFNELGESLFHKINNKDSLSKMQDIGFKHFGALGMQRGIKKELKGLDNNVNHQTIKAYHERQLNQLRKDISFSEITLNNMKFDIKEASKVLDIKTLQSNYINAFLDNFHTQATQILRYDTTNIEFAKVFKDLNNHYEKEINSLDSSLSEAKKLKQNLISEIGNIKEEKKIILNDIDKTKEQKHSELNELDNLLKQKRETQNQLTRLESELRGVRSEKKAHINQKHKVKENIEKFVKMGFLRDIDGLCDDLEKNFSFIGVMAQNEKNKTIIHHMSKELEYYKKLEEFGKLDKVVEQNTRLKESEKSLIDNNKNLSETIKDLKTKNIEKTITIEKQKEQFNKYQRRIRKTFSTKQKEKEINQNNYNKDR